MAAVARPTVDLPILQVVQSLLDMGDVLIFTTQLMDHWLHGVELLLVLLLQLAESVLVALLVLLKAVLELLDFTFIAILHLFEGFDEFLEHIDEAFCLPFLHARVLVLFGPGPLAVRHLAIFPEFLYFVVEHFDGVDHLLHLFVLLLLLVVIAVELLDGLSELSVDLDQLFQGLLEEGVLLLQFVDPIAEVNQLVLIGEVVLKLLGHPDI